MNVQEIRRVVVVAMLVALAFDRTALAATCRAESGPRRVPLVELYTSEGCSSCPPADRRLSALVQAGAVVPLAMHVDYWDSLGWKDRFGQPAFGRRQDWEVHASGHRTSFTPHFFVDGDEVEDWRGDLDDRLRKSSAVASAVAPVKVVVAAQPEAGDHLRVRVDATLTGPVASRGPLALVAVVTDSALSSQVGAGENRGARLVHDAVARYWLGEIPVKGNNAILERVLDVPELAGGHIAVVAFVQDTRDADVLQAVTTGFCRPD